MIGGKWKPRHFSSVIAFFACALAISPLNGSTAAQHWMMRSGCRCCISFTYSLVQGGVLVVVSRSSATSTASTPAVSNSLTTSSSCFQVQLRFQYLASASTYGPWHLLQGSVFG